ncbi:MAG: glycosyltransferase [Planctomycetota bacterium]|nr:glycosyltransferase [Planctomycetota bacterium]
MSPRKVAYLTPLYFDEASCLGGGERYPLNLARGVHHASGGRCRVELISFGAAARQLDLAEGVGLRVLPMARKPANPLDVVSWHLPDALVDCDLVHIHQAYTRCAEIGLLVAKQQRKPVCITDHGGFASPLGLEVGHLELADRIIAYSDFGASFYRTTRPITVIKGGVDAWHFRPPQVRPPRDRFLFVGRLLPHKGIDVLIAAMPDDCPLTICGRPYRPEYLAKLRSLAAGKTVEFVLDADDATIRDLYARSWATVLSSVYRDYEGRTHDAPELMGFTLLESMACGTPAIANRVGAMPEFILEGETGFVYDSPAMLSERLRQLAAEPETVERMGLKAREIVEVHYDLNVAGATLFDVYRTLCENRREVAA